MRLSKLHKAIISIQLAILLILPVSADTFGPYQFDYVAQDSLGIIYLTTDPCSFYPINNNGSTSTRCTFMVTRPNTNSDMIVLYPSTVNGVITYDIRYISYENNTDSNSIIFYDTDDGLVHFEDISTKYEYFYIYGDRSKYSTDYANISIRFSSEYQYSTQFYKIKANYQPLLKTSGGKPTKYGIPSENITVDTSITLEALLDGSNNQDIINTVNNIITVLQQNHNDIMNAGSGYPIPENGAELESAQNSLSEAEGAISDKSQTIKDQISSQVQSNLDLAASSANKVKQDSVQIKQLYATVTSSLPDEVKLLFVVVPLLLFVGWLIGRVRQ